MTDEQPSTTKEIVASVRGELTKYVAKAVVATAGGVITLAGLGLWLYVTKILPDLVGGVPRGAVVAFDRDDLDEDNCPPGWSPFSYARARTIVGAGDPKKTSLKMSVDDKGMPLIGYVLRQHGGEQQHKLTIAELPSSPVSLIVSNNGGGDWGVVAGAGGQIPGPHARHTGPLGNGEAINVMQPFIALYYCKKN